MLRPPPRSLVLFLLAGVVALATARLVAADLASLHRRAAGPGFVTTTTGRTPDRRPDAVVPPGMRAVRVAVEPVWRLPAGAVVDVLVPAGGLEPGEEPARTVAEGAVVLDASSGANGGAVTLLVTVDTARRVASAAAAGPLTLVLAPPEDACCRTSSSVLSRG